MENRYRQIYQEKSDKALLYIYQSNRSYYEDEVLETVEQILIERQVPFDKIDILDSTTILQKEADNTPMIVGIISLLITFSINYFGRGSLDIFTSLTITLVIRIVFLFYTSSLANDYSLNKTGWLIAVFFFGGWALIFLNFHIFSKENSTNESLLDNYKSFSGLPMNIKDKVEALNEEDENKKQGYVDCPACLKSLNGTNKCLDCDLEFI
jgi:hypothetical protein